MLERAETLIREYDMLPPGTTVLCAVSGGADSMCLLHWLRQKSLSGGFTLAAAHYNHRLRGEESDRDEAFVSAWCRDNGVPLSCGSGDVAAEAGRLGCGVEETARRMRYAFLYDTAGALGAQVIVTAHNADDNIETVLMDLIRGTGLQGLTGISPRRGVLARPLLTTSRAEIEAYLEAHGVPHVEDSSNRDDAFLRNRVRHRLIPLLEEWNPGFSLRMTAAIPTLRADNDLLIAQAGPIAALARRRGEELVLEAGPLAQAPDPVAVRAARLLFLAAAGARDIPSGLSGLSASHLKAIVSLARSADPSGQVCLPHGVTARREYSLLVFARSTPQPLTPFVPIPGENPIPGTGWTAVLSAGPWPGLVIRPRLSGDSVTLPGRPAKLLKELFIDEKVPRADRETIPVAADEQGVLAVAGFGPNTSHPRHTALRFIPTLLECQDPAGSSHNQ